jgi:hypothetical protein
MRRRLTKLGYTAGDFDRLDAEKARDFLTISNELDKIEAERSKKRG